MLFNSSTTLTYKVTLKIIPVNQYSGFLVLSNFKYPKMIERVIPPETKTSILTITKSIPSHNWGDYELKFEVEIIKDSSNTMKSSN